MPTPCPNPIPSEASGPQRWPLVYRAVTRGAVPSSVTARAARPGDPSGHSLPRWPSGTLPSRAWYTTDPGVLSPPGGPPSSAGARVGSVTEPVKEPVTVAEPVAEPATERGLPGSEASEGAAPPRPRHGEPWPREGPGGA